MDTETLKIALIVGSTRPNRFADVPVKWIVDGCQNRSDFELSVLDLREMSLPLFEEPISPGSSGGVFSSRAAEAWRKRLGGFDAFIATAAEYNGAPTAVLKNAFDSAFNEWRRKPIAFVGYGGVGAARAIESLKSIAVSLSMAPIKAGVSIAMEPFLGVWKQGKRLDDYDYLRASRAQMLDELVWWGKTLKRGRNA